MISRIIGVNKHFQIFSRLQILLFLKNLLMLVYTKLHSKFCYYQCPFSFHLTLFLRVFVAKMFSLRMLPNSHHYFTWKFVPAER